MLTFGGETPIAVSVKRELRGLVQDIPRSSYMGLRWRKGWDRLRTALGKETICGSDERLLGKLADC